MNPILASSLPAKRFVDPDNYSQSFYDQAVQNILLCMRSDSLWCLGPTLGAIGWRLKKHYFKVSSKPPECKSGSKSLVKSGSQTHAQAKHFHNSASCNNGNKAACSSDFSSDNSQLPMSHEFVLEWVEYGPDKYIEDKEITEVVKSLSNLKHPNIEPIVCAVNNENGCIIIRRFHRHGSLKDMLCMSSPKKTFFGKYGNPKNRATLSLKQLANYGKQILEALRFLHSIGYPYGHLHSGNIIIVEDCVKLVDIENYVLGVTSFYRPFYVQHSKINKPEAIDVYCFGHVLFEMAMGYPLQESVIRNLSDCPETLKAIFESILSKDACRSGLPTLDQLLQNDFFIKDTLNETPGRNLNDFEFSSSAKENIKKVVQKTELRLRDEQKSVKNQKRIVRVQEMMSSEEEKKKSKQKAKLESKQAKLRQQGSLQTSTERVHYSQTASDCKNIISPDTYATHFTRTSSVAVEHFRHNDVVDCKSTPPTNLTDGSQQSQNQIGNAVSTTSSACVERQSSSQSIQSEEKYSREADRSTLLDSICSFDRGTLRKARSNE